MVKRLSDVDKTRYVTPWEDKFRFGTMVGGHERKADENYEVGFLNSEDNYKAPLEQHPQNGIYGSEKHHQPRTRESYYRPERVNKHSTMDLSVIMNSQIMEMIVWVGGKQQPSYTFDRDNAGYAGQCLSGQVRTILVNTPYGTTKIKPVKSSYFGILDTKPAQKHMTYLYTKDWVSLLKRNR